MADPKVTIEVGDKVCVEFDGDPYVGVVSAIKKGKCTIGFDDGDTQTCDLKDVKLISKKVAVDGGGDLDAPATKQPAASPNAQQLENKANELRKDRVDTANEAKAADEAAADAENAGKPLTAAEKTFMGQVEAKMNGKDSRSDVGMVKTARMTALPSSSDMTKYARLKRQKEG